ncbi:MAG: DNA-formamidopyrimidine glycosylase [Candidatus Yanofskybacteria bacterium]|nr:DNA-formamidopyrimidine glycosylase [Candidatus Yanofskybacteria bacterium]
MPELPEVETIVRDLNKKVAGLKFMDFWTDWPKSVKTHKLTDFISEIKERKILRAHRRAKYIMLDLSEGKTLIIHQKISGHLLYGKWKIADGKPVADVEGPIKTDPYNRFVRHIFYLSNGHMLGFSDVRRFGKIFLGDTEKIENINEIGKLGPEPISTPSTRFHLVLTLEKFKEIMKKKKGLIKRVLMDPFTIAGIGNIYADEILWYAGVSPLRKADKLKDVELKAIFKSVRLVLEKAIKAKGDSEQDYRTLDGEFGGYQKLQKAYQQTGEKCQKKDGGVIKRVVINNRSAHFCPVHQK